MNSPGQTYKSGPSHRRTEMGVAVAMIALGAIVIGGSLQVGIGWGAEGPRSGFFPFYLGLVIIVTSFVNLVQASLIYRGKLFAEWQQLAQVWAVVVPAAIYVGVMPWTGIYAASVVLITYFMKRLGRYSIAFAGGVAVAMMVIVYLTFERWFLVPLPKGPIEDFLGL
jgi:putative tricarboxylic transport membrane protein